MATFHRVSITLPDDKRLSASLARDIIGTILPEEWPSVDLDTLKITRFTSYNNTHCSVERPPPASGTPSEPLKVFVRIQGQDGDVGALEVFKALLPTRKEESIMSYEFGRSGHGAKVFGVFQTQDGTQGRIDEFVDARNLEPEDVENDIVRRDIAKDMATFHATPFSVTAKPVDQYYDALIAGLKRYHGLSKLKQLGRDGGVSIDLLVDYDFVSRINEVIAKLGALGAKEGWCIHDVQYMNVMVRNTPKEHESRVVLIDFETVMRNYRGLDIGGHFMQKLFKWFDEDDKMTNCRPYSDDEKRHFCNEYARQWNAVAHDSDSGDQVYAEAQYGYLLAISFDIHNMLAYMNDVNDKDPLNLRGLNQLLAEFDNQYKYLERNAPI